MPQDIILGKQKVGFNQSPYIIAEACINHEGMVIIAEEMIYIAKAMGVNCIKFQIHVLENEMLRETPISKNFDESLWDTLDRTNLTLDEHRHLKKLCESLNIQYLCTPFSRDGVDLLEEINVDFYKVGSGEMTNHPLIEYIAKKGKPMIISTGMSEVSEIEETIKIVKDIGTDLAITHCTSAYPCPYDRVNLGMIPKYIEMFDIPVGLSDHSRGIYTALGAVAVGANIIEKHFTLDKMQVGADHPSSIEPYELGELVKGSEAIFKARGAEKHIFDEEKEIIAWARESVVAEVDIKKGQKIDKSAVWVKRPGPSKGGIPAKDLKHVIGKIAKVNIDKDKQIKWDEID